MGAAVWITIFAFRGLVVLECHVRKNKRMIIGRSKTEDSEVLLLGMSHENVTRLLSGQPIRLRRVSHGDGIPEGWDILIFCGETEQSMRQELERGGVVGEDTNIIVDPRIKT
jgi:hypothetical protein